MSFTVVINSYISIFYLIRKLLLCRKTKTKFREKKIVDSGIVKRYDELDLQSFHATLSHNRKSWSLGQTF